MTLKHSTSLSSHPTFLSQSFVSIPTFGGSVGHRRDGRPSLPPVFQGELHSSHTQFSSGYQSGRRYTSPVVHAPLMSQPPELSAMGNMSYTYKHSMPSQGEEVFVHSALFPTYSQSVSNWRSVGQQDSRGTALAGESSRLDQHGSLSVLSRRTSTQSQSQKSSDSHENQLNFSTTGHSPSHTYSRHTFSQPGHGEPEGFVPHHMHGVTHKKHATVGSRHPQPRPNLFSMTQFVPGGGLRMENEGLGMERRMFHRASSFTPLRHHSSLHGTSGIYQPKVDLHGSKPNTSSGSLATSVVDSAYASGLSNHSSNPRSSTEPEDGLSSRATGMGMRPQEERGNHPLQPSSSVTSRSSSTGSRDSSHFPRRLSEEEGPLEWEVSVPHRQYVIT